jgi:A/G-specific adenine glycosylase
MNTLCVAALEGRQAELPGRKAKRARRAREATLLIAENGSAESRKILLEKRPAPGIWGGLWSPPQFEDAAAALDWCRRELGEPVLPAIALAPIDHAFTHFDLTLHPIRVHCAPRQVNAVADTAARLWYSLTDPPRVGLPQPIRKLIDRLASEH